MSAIEERLKFYSDIMQKFKNYFSGIELIGMDVGQTVYNDFFRRHVLFDVVWASIGSLFVIIGIWALSESFLFTLLTIFGMILSIGSAFFIYSVAKFKKIFKILLNF